MEATATAKQNKAAAAVNNGTLGEKLGVGVQAPAGYVRMGVVTIRSVSDRTFDGGVSTSLVGINVLGTTPKGVTVLVRVWSTPAYIRLIQDRPETVVGETLAVWVPLGETHAKWSPTYNARVMGLTSVLYGGGRAAVDASDLF